MASNDNGHDGGEIVKHLARLRWQARTMAANEADAADLVQDTMEKALRALPRLRAGSNVGAWLSTLLSHTFIDQYRWAGVRGRRVSADEVDLPATEPEIPPWWLEIEEPEIHAAVDRLPPMFAVIFRMRVFARLSYAEIAQRLGIPSGTVGTRLKRANERLRDILTAEAAPSTAEPVAA